jgi:two-component system KDP operon response regulator KdpE
VSRVLVVDDDPQLTRALRISLRASGYEVVAAADGRAALREAAAHHPDLVVLDLGLPDLDGTEVLAGLRLWFTGPVLVLAARVDSRDKIGALDAGADDYVSKPFDMGELLARLRALQRRGTAESEASVVRSDAFTVDLTAKQVIVDGAVVRLTPTEWGLLSELVRAPGRLVSQRQLLQAVWGPAYERETHYLRVYMGSCAARSSLTRPSPGTGSPSRGWATASLLERPLRSADDDTGRLPRPGPLLARSSLRCSRGCQPTCTRGRRVRSGSASRSTSRVTGATSPAPVKMNRSRFSSGLPSVHSK